MRISSKTVFCYFVLFVAVAVCVYEASTDENNGPVKFYGHISLPRR